MKDVTKKQLSFDSNFNEKNKFLHLVALLFFCLGSVQTSFACDPYYEDFCHFTSENSELNIISCEITEIFDNKAEVKILKEFTKYESEKSITIWDAETYDCYGYSTGTVLPYFGMEGDTVICVLEEVIEPIWPGEKIGDYKVVTELTGGVFVKVNNGKLSGAAVDGKSGQYTYNEFLTLMKSGDCIAQKNNCNIENPLKLPWLAEKIEGSLGNAVGSVKQFQFSGETYFGISSNVLGCMADIEDDLIDPVDPFINYYDCKGTLICSSATKCEANFTNEYYRAPIIWTYCDDRCNYKTKGKVKYSNSEDCGYLIELYNGETFSVSNTYKEFIFTDGQVIEFSYKLNDFNFGGNNSCQYSKIQLICIRETETLPTCKYENTGTLTKDDKCGYLIKLDDGTILEAILFGLYEDGQQVEFSYRLTKERYQGCSQYELADIYCIRKIETPGVCDIPETKITSSPIICGRGTLNLETDFSPENDINLKYVFVKVSKADDSFEILTNTSISDASACYYGIAYSRTCDIPDFGAENFSIILNANADYTVTNCFEIERAEGPIFSITTEPYCIGNNLFTVGITLSGASGMYIIGVDYTGNEVEGVDGENLITFKSGEPFYALRPRDAVTGCAQDFGLSVKDPGCGCICPAVVAPVCGEDGQTYGNACLAACAGVEVSYNGACNTLPKIFVKYEWLNDYVNPNNCDAGTQVNVYKGGFYNFVYIKLANGEESMHFENGTLICKNGADFSCLDFFEFGNPITTWSCNAAGVSNPVFFENYPWLKPMVDENNCYGTTIKQYEKGVHKYILVETETMNSLYYQSSYLFCTNADASVCIEKFRLSQPTQMWICDDGNNKTISNSIENPFTVFPNPSTGQFKVELENSNADTQTLNIMDVNGKVLQTKNIAPSQKSISINLPATAKGIYLIQVVSSNNTNTRRIILH